jgi:succinate dehydrogenase / fumarate reductase, cytochrome b subunit
LFAGFIIHIVVGIIIKLRNDRARPIDYYVSTKSKISPFSKYMFVTGAFIFVFLIIHLYNFFFVKVGLMPMYGGAQERTDFFPMVAETLKNPFFAVFYMISVILLGMHLRHGFQSAFQSFGLNHDKYTPTIKILGIIYTVIITTGFLIIPVYFLFFY